MLRDSVSAMEFSQPVCTITAEVRDLFGGRLVFHMILSLADPYRTNWGVLLADSGTIRRKLLDQLRDALVCSYYVRCVSTPEIFADVSVNHSRTGAVKLLITRRDEQSSKLLRGPFAGLQPVPGGRNWGCDPAPAPKRMTRPCASRTLLSSCLRGQCRLTAVGTLDAGPSRTGPPRPFRRSQLCTLCWPALLRRPISGALSTGPNVDGVAAGFKEVSYYHRVTPCGLSNRARRTPRSWRGLPPRRSPTLGVGAFRRRGTAGFRRAACAAHRCGPWGLWIRFSHA